MSCELPQTLYTVVMSMTLTLVSLYISLNLLTMDVESVIPVIAGIIVFLVLFSLVFNIATLQGC